MAVEVSCGSVRYVQVMLVLVVFGQARQLRYGGLMFGTVC